MTSLNSKRREPPAAALAQAAAWVARLHGPNRTQEVEDGLRRWLADDPDHAAAFEILTDTWEKSARLKRRPLERVVSWERVGFRMSFSRVALATAFTFVLAVIATVAYLHSDAVTTGIGEFRTLSLADGTRVHLNTNTRVSVHFDKQFRRVSLEKGEALFEVAKRPDWPFIVSAGYHQIKALGTAFVVRTEGQHLAVTLVEGKVTVSSTPKIDDPNPAPNSGTSAPAPLQEAKPDISGVITLSPGQRVTIAPMSSPKIDQPALDRVTAWERGQVSFDNTPLSDAVAEMNRYSQTQILLQAPGSEIRSSGIFEAGDSMYFAQAIARTYGLTLAEDGAESLVLSENTSTAVGESGPR